MQRQVPLKLQNQKSLDFREDIFPPIVTLMASKGAETEKKTMSQDFRQRFCDENIQNHDFTEVYIAFRQKGGG